MITEKETLLYRIKDDILGIGILIRDLKGIAENIKTLYKKILNELEN